MGALKLSEEILAELDDVMTKLKKMPHSHLKMVPTVSCSFGCSNDCSGSCASGCTSGCSGSNY